MVTISTEVVIIAVIDIVNVIAIIVMNVVL